MVFSGVMDQAMSILLSEETSSSSTRWPKRHQRHINRDHEAAHFKPHHE
jgi:hypothetical protein